MTVIKKALSKVLDKLDKTRTIDKETAEKILKNNKAAQDAKKQG